jgi:hypothetical protein
MGFLDDLAALVEDPAIRRFAERRARNRELAEDALQETYRAVAQTGNPEAIEDLRKFFFKSLIRTINRQLTLATPISTDVIDAIADSGRNSGTPSSDSVADEAQLRILAEVAFTRLERDRSGLMAMIPARSDDPHRYRCTILATAWTVLYLLLRGPVTTADWNAALRSEYPQWCDEPGLPSDAMYQRLSRARADVQLLLRVVLPRDRIAS